MPHRTFRTPSLTRCAGRARCGRCACRRMPGTPAKGVCALPRAPQELEEAEHDVGLAAAGAVAGLPRLPRARVVAQQVQQRAPGLPAPGAARSACQRARCGCPDTQARCTGRPGRGELSRAACMTHAGGMHGNRAAACEGVIEAAHLTRPDLRHSEANFRLVARSCRGGTTRPRTHSRACTPQHPPHHAGRAGNLSAPHCCHAARSRGCAC